MRRFLAWALGIVLVLGVVALAGVGWYYSGEILDVEQPGEPDRDTEVLAIDGQTVTLPATAETTIEGIWGLDAPEAYAQISSIVQQDAETVTRHFESLDGTLRPGDLVDVDAYAYPPDPSTAFDFGVSEVELGEYPAWVATGNSDRWAVIVHGRGARRHECFRLLRVLRERHQFNVICPTYRNDIGVPADPDGIYRQGAQEWRDIEPAVQYALDEGADDLVLAGLSMGGQITANLLRHSPLAKDVDAVIWDSPLLDWGPVIAAGAVDRGVPNWLVPIGMQASEWEAGVDYENLNQIVNADEFNVPILLFHGAKDTTVPVDVGQRFADARPDLVTFRRFADAEHVRSWNTLTPAYEQSLGRFLAGAL